jgi:hypothetical protein
MILEVSDCFYFETLVGATGFEFATSCTYKKIIGG